MKTGKHSRTFRFWNFHESIVGIGVCNNPFFSSPKATVRSQYCDEDKSANKMKTSILFLLFLFPAVVCSEAIQQRFASESNMCSRLVQGLGLTTTSNRFDVLEWSTPTNLIVQSLNWTVEENSIDVYDNCRLISLSLFSGTTNITADIRLCGDSATALFSMVLPEVAFSSMDPLRQISDYLLETDCHGARRLFRRLADDSGNPGDPDLGRFDYLLGNVSVFIQGPLDLRAFPAAILRAGGVDIPDEPEPQDPNLDPNL